MPEYEIKRILDLLDEFEFSIEKVAEMTKTPVEYVKAIKTNFSEKAKKVERSAVSKVFWCPECKREVKKNKSHCPSCKTRLAW